MGFGTLQRSDSWARLKNQGLKHFHMWSKEPEGMDLSVPEKEEFELSKEYEVKCQLCVNDAEGEGSAIVGGFPAGTYVTILDIGSPCLDGRRLKVANKPKTVIGWVSSISRGKPTLCKVSSLRSNVRRRSDSLCSLSSRISSSVTKLRRKADLNQQPTKSRQIGDVLEIESRVIVREDESMRSRQLLSIAGGCKVQILDFGRVSENRVKVSVNGTTGWVTILDKGNAWEPCKAWEPLFGCDPEVAPKWSTY